MTAGLRSFFAEEGFWEVETPVWSADTCVDAWIEPVAVDLPGVGPGFLQTSPEFHMKRLLCEGADRVYQLSRVFRGGESGRLHNPEFTMLEWYAVGEDHHDAMARTERLVRRAVPALAGEPFPRLSYYGAMSDALDADVAAMSPAGVVSLAESMGHRPGPSDDVDDALNFLLAEAVEPRLAELPAVFLTDYPATQAALAKVRGGEPPAAERFELYVRGVEVANGYHEETDAAELRRRFDRLNGRRAADGRPRLPADSRFLEATAEGFPPSAGVAVGWDRVVMLALGLDDVRRVMAFPAGAA